VSDPPPVRHSRIPSERWQMTPRLVTELEVVPRPTYRGSSYHLTLDLWEQRPDALTIPAAQTSRSALHLRLGEVPRSGRSSCRAITPSTCLPNDRFRRGGLTPNASNPPVAPATGCWAAPRDCRTNRSRIVPARRLTGCAPTLGYRTRSPVGSSPTKAAATCENTHHNTREETDDQCCQHEIDSNVRPVRSTDAEQS